MGGLFQDLKKRKVFTIAAVYAVVAWLTIQIVDVINDPLSLPEWFPTVTIVLFAIGFPLALILAWAYEVTPEGIKPDSAVQEQAQVPVPQSQRLMYATFILVLLAVGFQIADRFLFGSVNQTEVISSDGATPAVVSNLSRRFTINIGDTRPQVRSFLDADIALSADGHKLVYTVLKPDTGVESLYLKNLDQLGEQVLVNGTANAPFFSADGEWVGFFATVASRSALYKQSIRGGAPQLLTGSTMGGSGGFWSADDTVYYTSSNLQLMRVSANDGVPEPLNIDVGNFNSAPSWPYLLPGDDALLYTVAYSASVRNGRINLLVESTGEVRTIIQNGYNARYVPTGHVVFVRDATLWAVPFDVTRLLTTGPERPVIQGIQTNIQRGRTPYAFSDDGLLVYLPGGERSETSLGPTELIWVDREGIEEALPKTQNFLRWAVSPDGRRLAVSITDSSSDADIWIYDLDRDTLSRLTSDEANDYRPLWTPDGGRIVFGSTRDGGGLWWRAADGTGVPERLLSDSDLTGGDLSPYAFTPDGTQILYWSGGDLYTLALGDEVLTQPLLQYEFNTQKPDLSPDGRWLAYASDETGPLEIYVRPFPNIDDENLLISREGGDSPKWSPDGLELYFVRPENDGGSSVWVARRETADSLQFGVPVRAFEGSNAVTSVENTFDLSADGSRILLRRDAGSNIQETVFTQLIAVDNWFEELKRLAPPDQP